MLHKVWAGENRKMTVCVDAYEDGVMKGRIQNAYQETETFGSMVQFLTVVSQQLLPDCHGGMVPACEILQLSSAVKSMIRDNKNHQIDNVIASGSKEGMCTMDQSILSLFRCGMISRETALEYADRPEQLERLLG